MTGGELNDVTPDCEGHVEYVHWADDETVRFFASRGVQSVYEEIGADGTGRRTIVSPDAGGSVFTTLLSSDDGRRVKFVAESPTHPDEVYLLDGGTLRRLTDSNAGVIT